MHLIFITPLEERQNLFGLFLQFRIGVQIGVDTCNWMEDTV